MAEKISDIFPRDRTNINQSMQYLWGALFVISSATSFADPGQTDTGRFLSAGGVLLGMVLFFT